MMRVHQAPEPDAFDELVRQPGRRALDRLAAEKYSGSKEAVPAREFPPHWRRSLDDLLAAYSRICSYLCLYIPRGTGARSVDHMVPKSMAWGSSLRVGQLPARVLADEFPQGCCGFRSGSVRRRRRMVRAGACCLSGVACRRLGQSDGLGCHGHHRAPAPQRRGMLRSARGVRGGILARECLVGLRGEARALRRVRVAPSEQASRS